MRHILTRRHALALATIGIAGAAAAALVPAPAFADTGSALSRTEVSGHTSLITGAGTNVTVLETPEGLVIVDGGDAEHSTDLLAFLEREFAGAPVVALFTTHWHPSHSGIHDALGAAGTPIYAHEYTRQWMSTEYYVDWERTTYSPRDPAALPTRTFRSSSPQPLSLAVGGHTIEYGHLAEAHTDGDLYVRFVEENVLVVGDVMSPGTWPVPDHATGGWIGGLQNSTRLLLTLADSATRVIAGTGPPQTRADLEAQTEMLDTVHERIRLQMIAGKGVDEIVAGNVDDGYEHLGDIRPFVYNVYHGLWWGGRLRGAY